MSDVGDNVPGGQTPAGRQHDGGGRRERTAQQDPPRQPPGDTGQETTSGQGSTAPADVTTGATGKAGGGTGTTRTTSTTAPGAPAGATGLTADERAELERLRAEVAELRSRPPAPPTAHRRRGGWRTPVASLLIVLGCLLAPVSVLAVWTANQVSDTNRYVDNVAPLIHEPAVQKALTDKISAEINAQLHIQNLTNQAADTLSSKGLPRVATLLHTFSGSLASAVGGFIHTQVAKIVASQQVANLWVRLNRSVHTQLVKALSGQGGGAVTTSNGKVVLNLGPFIDQVKKNLVARGFSIAGHIPAINPTLTLFSAKYLVKAQTGYRLINDLKIVLPLLTLLLLTAGIYIARSHRRALVGAGLGFAASMFVLAIALAIARSIYLNSVPSSVLPSDAAAVMYDTLVRFIKYGLRVLLVVGLIVAIGAFFTGPSVTAVTTRRALSNGLGWLRTRGERAGVSSGPVGTWTYHHRRGLRIGAVMLFALIFVFWGRPTVTVAIVLAILLVVVLGLIELIGRPPVQSASPQAAGQPGG